MLYYDLVASLPTLPYFERAERLPITRLRLGERLGLLKPAHAEQLARARSFASWRLERSRWRTDAAQVEEYAAMLTLPFEPALRDYVTFRMEQRTLLAALRRKQEGLDSLHGIEPWGAGRWVRHIHQHWNEPDFRLAHLYPWLPQARELLAAGDARGLDSQAMAVAWRWLDRCAERSTFGFEAAVSYFFRWDILDAWLARDAARGKRRFGELIAQVTHVEHS